MPAVRPGGDDEVGQPLSRGQLGVRFAVDETAAVQPVVRLKAASLGEVGQAWLDALPDLVAELESRWSVKVEKSLGGGTAAYVARARTANGASVIMKLCVPDPDFGDEIGTLDRADGRGYVRLLAHDADRHAMLLEELGPSMSRSGMSPDAQIATLCELLTQAWEVPRADSGKFAIAQDKATALARFVSRVWSELDAPCSELVRDRALLYAERRAAAFNPERCVVAHGDAAAMNALRVLAPRRGAETGFVFVDPDGFIGDPAYDLGVVLRDWCSQLLGSSDPLGFAWSLCRLLAAGSGVDEQAIWEWGYLERVSTGMYARSLGANELGQPFLDTADLLR